jgi:hypothetical protein
LPSRPLTIQGLFDHRNFRQGPGFTLGRDFVGTRLRCLG